MYVFKLKLIKLKVNLFEYLLRAVVGFSVIMIIKTSEYPIVVFKSNRFLSKLFLEFQYDNSLYQSIFVGIVVSYIFYLIVVRFPEKRRSKNIDIVLNEKIGSVLFSSCGILRDLIRQSGKEIELYELNDDIVRQICCLVHKDSIVPGVCKNLDREKYRYGEYLASNWNKLIISINDILNNNAIMDSEFLKLLYMLRDCKLWIIMSTITNQRINMESLETSSDLFIEFYEITKKLNDYYYSHFKDTQHENCWSKSYYGYRVHIDFDNWKLLIHRGDCYIVNRILKKANIDHRKNKLIGTFKSKKNASLYANFLQKMSCQRLKTHKCENENC